MGAGESSERSNHREREERLKAHEADVRRQRELLEAQIQELEAQRMREYWKQQQALEEQKRKEALLEWQRQEDLRRLKLAQEKIRKELEEQKLERKLERERLEKKLREQEEARAEESAQQSLLQKVKVHRQSWGRSSTTVESGKVDSPGTAAALQRRTSATVETKAEPKPEEKRKSYVDRMNEANVKCAEWSIVDYVKDTNGISKTVAEQIMELFDEDNTVSFVARYRKHLTGGMDAKQLSDVRESYEQAKLMKRRAVSIIKDIEQKGRWTPEFHAFVHETKSLIRLERIYEIFNAAETKIVQRATSAGLGIVAEACLKNRTFVSPSQLVQESLDGLETEDLVREGLVALMAAMIIKDRWTFDTIDAMISRYSMEIETTKIETGKSAKKQLKNGEKYESYYSFKCKTTDLHFRQVFKINRGQELKILRVKINIPDTFEEKFKEQCLSHYKSTGIFSAPKKDLIASAINVAFVRSIRSSVARRTRQEINERALKQCMNGMMENVREILLVPPVRGKAIIGISPGFESGCKLAVISAQGNVLETKTIYPNNGHDPRFKLDAERVLAGMVCKHGCKIFALGNGPASGETERFLNHALKNKKIASSDVSYAIVDESVASTYSQSSEATLEFPNFSADIISAVSIARRLQNPMDELVKIDSEHFTKKMHQPEVPIKELSRKINEVIVAVVSYVGVDVNTASLALLKRVAGLDEAKAKSIVEWRKKNGPFINRNDLLKVRGISKHVFQQCAGFIRILPETAPTIGGQPFNFFDRTWIHPESYGIAQSLLDDAGCNALPHGTNDFKCALSRYIKKDSTVLAKKLKTDAKTIEMIVVSLIMDPNLDIRGTVDDTKFRKSMIRFNDLCVGTLLSGVVTGLAKFGAFVDVGAEIAGLIHNSSMNGMTVAVDQKVEVRVSSISRERGRLGLSLIKCV